MTKDANVKIALFGDVMLGRFMNETLKTRLPEHPWGDTLPVFQKADVRISNLECVLSDGGSPARKAFTFRSDAKNVTVLEAARINAVSLANNHSLDYGPEALADTLGILDQKGIRHAGAGRTLPEAQAPATMEIGMMTIGMLAVTDTDEMGWASEAKKPGVWRMPIDTDDPEAKELFERVRVAKRTIGMLIVSLHWGSNWGYEPEKGHEGFAHALIDAGADIIFGHSCHVCRGIEIYKGKPILYGVGNFIDDYAVDKTERNDETFVFLTEFDRQGELLGVSLYPAVIENCQVNLAKGERGRSMARKMQELCRELGTTALWDESLGAVRLEAR